MSSEYQKIVTIGQGVHGKVYSVKNIETGEIFAMKKYPKILEDFTIREISLIQSFNHPNLPRAIEIDVVNKIIVMPLARCDLTKYISEIGFSHIDPSFRIYINQLVSAVHYLHSHELRHGDIKPDNILVYDPGFSSPTKNLVLMDFGITATIISDGKRREQAQASYFAPPEISWGSRSGKETDIYALGVVIMEMTTGWIARNGPSNDMERNKAGLIHKFLKKVEPGYFRNLVTRMIAPVNFRHSSNLLIRMTYFYGLKHNTGNPIKSKSFPRLTKSQINLVKDAISETNSECRQIISSATKERVMEYYRFLAHSIRLFAKVLSTGGVGVNDVTNVRRLLKGCFFITEQLSTTGFLMEINGEEGIRIFEMLKGQVYFLPELDPKKFIEGLLIDVGFRLVEDL